MKTISTYILQVQITINLFTILALYQKKQQQKG